MTNVAVLPVPDLNTNRIHARKKLGAKLCLANRVAAVQDWLDATCRQRLELLLIHDAILYGSIQKQILDVVVISSKHVTVYHIKY